MKCGRKLTLRPDIDAGIGLSALLAAFLAIRFLPDDDLVAHFAAVLGMIFATQLLLTYAAAALTPIAHHDRTGMAASRYRLHIALLLILVLFVAALLWLSNVTR